MTEEENKQLRTWADSVHKGCAEKMKSSAIYAGILTNNFIDDPVCALQLGLAILYNKPIILLADNGIKIPPVLEKIASLIERVDTNSQNDLQRASQAITNYVEKMGAH